MEKYTNSWQAAHVARTGMSASACRLVSKSSARTGDLRPRAAGFGGAAALATAATPIAAPAAARAFARTHAWSPPV